MTSADDPALVELRNLFVHVPRLPLEDLEGLREQGQQVAEPLGPVAWRCESTADTLAKVRRDVLDGGILAYAIEVRWSRAGWCLIYIYRDDQ